MWLLAPAAQGETGTLAQQKEIHSSELGQLREKIGRLRDQLNEAKGARAEQRRALQAAESAIGRLVRRLQDTDRRLAGHRKRLVALESDRRKRQSRLGVQREALARQLRAAYLMGRRQRLKLLLNQADPVRVGRVVTYYDYLNRARATRIGEIRQELSALAQVERGIQHETGRLRALRNQQEAEQQALEQSRRDRRRIVATLGAEIDAGGAQLQVMRENVSRLETLLSSIESELARIHATPDPQQRFADSRGQLSWPVAGRITARFGAPRGGGSLQWGGVRISAREGAPVTAIAQGRIAFADWLRGFGLLIILDHGDGYMSLYGHNQSVAREVGDWVAAGEIIAGVGDSGGQKQPALYFAIRENGRPVNPQRWCLKFSGDRIPQALAAGGLTATR